MRFLVLALLAAMAVHAHAGFLRDAERDRLVSLALEHFWGNARYPDGRVIQPASDDERRTLPVPRPAAEAAVDAGEVSGLAQWCGLDWQPRFRSFVAVLRSRGYSEKQVAFMTTLHGVVQGHIENTMASSTCGDKERRRLGGTIAPAAQRAESPRPPQLWSDHKVLAIDAQRCADRAYEILQSMALVDITRNGSYTYANQGANRAAIKCVALGESESSFVYVMVAGPDKETVEGLRNRIVWGL